MKLTNTILQVYLCGDNTEAKQAVALIATKLGLTVLDKGSLSAARELEDFPLKLFPEWRLPLCIAVGLAAFFFFYLLMRDVIYAYVENRKEISYRIMVSLANKVKLCFLHLVSCILVFIRPLSLCGHRVFVCLIIVFFPLFNLQVFPIVALVMLSLCYLPGAIAAFFQLYRGTKYRSDIKTG